MGCAFMSGSRSLAPKVTEPAHVGMKSYRNADLRAVVRSVPCNGALKRWLADQWRSSLSCRRSRSLPRPGSHEERRIDTNVRKGSEAYQGRGVHERQGGNRT